MKQNSELIKQNYGSKLSNITSSVAIGDKQDTMESPRDFIRVRDSTDEGVDVEDFASRQASVDNSNSNTFSQNDNNI